LIILLDGPFLIILFSYSPAGNVHVSAWMIFLPFPALNLLDESEYHTGRILCADLHGCVYCPCAS